MRLLAAFALLAGITALPVQAEDAPFASRPAIILLAKAPADLVAQVPADPRTAGLKPLAKPERDGFVNLPDVSDVPLPPARVASAARSDHFSSRPVVTVDGMEIPLPPVQDSSGKAIAAAPIHEDSSVLDELQNANTPAPEPSYTTPPQMPRGYNPYQ